MSINIASVTSPSESERGHPAENVLDTSPDVYFAAGGGGGMISLDVRLEKEAEFNTVAIGFFDGKAGKTGFTVYITNDFVDFDGGHHFTSSGDTNGPQYFPFPAVTAGGVRITFDDTDRLSISRVTLYNIQQQQQEPAAVAPKHAAVVESTGCCRSDSSRKEVTHRKKH